MHMNATNRLIGAALAAAMAVTAGCATGPEAVEEDFGNSVRHMTQVQTANPSAPMDAKAIDHGDGERANSAIEAYRKDVGEREEIKQEVVIDVGGGK
jgi:type IV pilus biogenesis protein CpaD/CtpE